MIWTRKIWHPIQLICMCHGHVPGQCTYLHHHVRQIMFSWRLPGLYLKAGKIIHLDIFHHDSTRRVIIHHTQQGLRIIVSVVQGKLPQLSLILQKLRQLQTKNTLPNVPPPQLSQYNKNGVCGFSSNVGVWGVGFKTQLSIKPSARVLVYVVPQLGAILSRFWGWSQLQVVNR